MRIVKALVNSFQIDPGPQGRRAAALVLVIGIAALGVGMPMVPHAGGPDPVTASPTQSVQTPGNLPDAHNSFGLRAIQSLAHEEQNKNIFISPTSIALALSMTMNGARGETKSAMQKALQVQNVDVSTVNQESLRLIRRLNNPDPKVQLSVANSVWARKGLSFRGEFLGAVKDYYNADVSVLDFDNRSAVDTINAWGNRNTKGKIPTIVQKIPAHMVMYLINAVYFKGDWTTQFDKRLTEDRTFTPADGAPRKHPLMRRHGRLPYFATEDFQAVALSYGKNKRFAMYVFLTKDLNRFVAGLDGRKWSNWMKQYQVTEGTLLLPRFKMQYQAELKDLLTQFGMGIAFSEGADFAGIGNGNFFISQVSHKTYVDVNEEGTEAAAATRVDVGITSVPKTFYMEVNRPFFFAISDTETNEILVAGIVQNP